MLAQRIRTALLMAVPLLVILFLVPKWLAILAFAALVLAGGWEWAGLAGWQDNRTRSLYVTALAICMVCCWHFITTLQQLQMLLVLTLVFWSLAFAWVLAFPQAKSRLVVAASGLIVLTPAWLSLAQLQRQETGPQWVLFMVALVVAMDVGGYFVGGRFGRHKLAPQVSPGKSWEGVMGGVLIAAAVAVLGGIGFAMPLRAFLMLCLFTALLSIVGDLTESLFKRHAGLKDSGNLLPGHGGILDRIDSMTAAAPLFLWGLIQLDVFPS